MQGWARYRRLMALPGVPGLVVLSVLARLPLGTLPLLVLLGVGAARSLPVAGLTVAAFSLCSAVASPVRGRLVDRVGPVGVLAVSALVQSAAILALALALARGWPDVALPAAAGAAGLFLPPAGPVTRSVWPRLVPEPTLAVAAFSLDALLLQVIYYTVGPPLAAFLAGRTGGPVALAAVAAITLVGVVGLAVLAPVRRLHHGRDPAEPGHWAGPLRRPAVSVVLATTACSAAAIAALEIVVVAYTLARGVPGWSGALLALLGVGSIAGGLRQGARALPRPLAAQYPRWLLGLASGALLTGVVIGAVGARSAGPWLVGAALVAAGFAVGPISTCQFGLVGELAPNGTVTEGFTWLFSLSLAGNAAGNALGSSAAAGLGAALAMGLPVAAGALAAAVTLMLRRHPARAPAT